MKLFLFLLFMLTTGFAQSQQEITEAELTQHIEFLTAEDLKGRYPGTPENDSVVNYLVDNFSKNEISVLVQEFEAQMRKDSSIVKTYNVLGLVEGKDSIFKNEVIVLGAHYDHLGMKGDSIYHGADDNASGIAALLEIAEKVKAHQNELQRSIIFIAFGAEEQGLLGSQFFVENPIIPIDQIKLMMNMDMLGHLNTEKHLYMGGAGTFPGGVELMKSLANSDELNPIVHAGGVGGSDHVSFYRKGISVLGFHTGGHDYYRQPSDTIEHLNIPGEVIASNYIYQALMEIAASERELEFIEQD
ncbi:M20/M25/M40 family metallo-hydrolase [Mesonia sp.]|uniref:M28 family metallopeptidase n=1 Tax=Mesonia sp. TaxID=1960830 RepID=UPI00176FD18A|nr:M20/M25/M40 family metallo-hydrolase [Mesonia sp.]HIB37257.1 M20/M25/M40 family metallo-hydrolase [Mesonia sp.]HIO26981.1 M20/M25/M40 family metallo-hydrolase [Flavobacteriaceae bacterium]